jgi:hypothetical protein
MDEQTPTTPGVMDEVFKGNLRIRIHRMRTIDSSLTCFVEVVAWNEWAGQGKLLYAQGGIDLEDAKELFAFLIATLRGYDWHDNEVLLEEK